MRLMCKSEHILLVIVKHERNVNRQKGTVPRITEGNTAIAIITSLFYPYYGGAEKQTKVLAKELASRGVKPYLLTRRLNGLKGFESLHNVSVYRVFSTRVSSSALSTLTFIISSCVFFVTHPGITRRVRIIQGDCDSPGLIAVIVGKLFRKKVVMRMRGPRQLDSIKSSLLIKTYFKIISKLSDAIITQYNQFDDLECLGVEFHKVHKIPNGVDTNYFRKFDSPTRQALREKMGYKNSIVGLYVGRLDSVKGVDILINCFHILIKKHPKFRLVIVGSGSTENYLKNLAKTLNLNTYIMFAGAKKDVKLYYGIADAFFLISKSEGASNALLEAMSMSLPVLVSDIGGSVEIIKDEYNGLLTNPYILSNVLEQSQKLLRDPALREKLGMYARKTVERNFSINRVVTNYLSVYSNMINRGYN